MTEAERFLWQKIRNKQIKEKRFYRQKIIGNYIVDFYCPKSKLVIELDGGQHYTRKGINQDKRRDKYLQNLELKILRFSDRELFKNTEGVLTKIYCSL